MRHRITPALNKICRLDSTRHTSRINDNIINMHTGTTLLRRKRARSRIRHRLHPVERTCA